MVKPFRSPALKASQKASSTAGTDRLGSSAGRARQLAATAVQRGFDGAHAGRQAFRYLFEAQIENFFEHDRGALLW